MLKDYNSYYRATEAVVYGRVVNDEVIAWETPPEGTRKSELIEQSKTELAGCFVAGTRIKTAEGDKNIEDIQAGDEVYACDVETGEVGLKKVKRTFIHEETLIVRVTIENTTIETTTEHPFYVEGYGFKYACNLQPGDEIRQLDGTTAEVQKIEYEYLDEPIYVYNFEVEDWHTYYVSDIGALVHNDCMAPPPTSGSEIKTSYGKSSPNLTKPKGWKVGDPIDNLTRTGKEPSWSTVRARYWKNKAYYYADDYLDSDLIRMRKGLAPIEPETGASMELHHKNGRDIPNPHNIENLQEVWPWEHDAIDKFRHYTGPRPKGE